MSALERPFIDAIAANQINGATLRGCNVSGKHYSQVYGTRTLLDGTLRPLSIHDILFLASGTKLLTTIAALQCCERKLLSLDADLSPLLPELVNLGVIVNDDSSDGPSTEPLRKTLTLRRLLTHSSGQCPTATSPALKRWRDVNPAPKDASDVFAKFLHPLGFQPGDEWRYSTSLDWTGYLVEKVTAMRLDEYFRINLLQPLGVEPTEVSFFPVKEHLGDRMPDLNPLDPGGTGFSAIGGKGPIGTPATGCLGGSGAYASAEAYISVLHSILANNGKLLTGDSVAEMFKPQLEPAARESFIAALAGRYGPFLSQNTSGPNRDFGLGGLLVGEDGDAGLGKNSLTWGGGLNSSWFIDRTNGVCGFVCLQLPIPSGADTALALRGVFRRGLREHLEYES